MKIWSTPLRSTLIARAVGPPHGSRFITPAAKPTIAGRTSGFISIRRCTGNSAVMEMRNVVAPSPSKATSMAKAAVARQSLMGSPRTTPIRRSTSGAKSPTSIMSPKYRTANIIMEATGATVFRPSTANEPSWLLRPPATAATTGVKTSAAMTGVLVKATSSRNAEIVAQPRIARAFINTNLVSRQSEDGLAVRLVPFAGGPERTPAATSASATRRVSDASARERPRSSPRRT